MFSGSFNLLAEGLEHLCRADDDVERLISPRRAAIFVLLTQYILEIEQYNPELKMVGTNDRHALIVRHILDSLAPLGEIYRLLGGGRTFADVGSGAGLPGIPLAIALPEVEFTLIESKGLRAGFLRHTKKAIGLPNIVVEETEMEQAKPGRFVVVTSRAFRPLDLKIVRGLFRLCIDKGTLTAYKGRRERIEAEITALERLVKKGSFTREVIPYPVPFLDEQRHFLCLRKTT